MSQCIKCGVDIPAGELFCPECSLNPGSSLFDTPKASDRHSLPIGRMQTPQPMKRKPVQTQVQTVRIVEKKKAGVGTVLTIILLILLLAASVSFQIWQYGDIQAEKNRLRTKDADLSLRQTEIDNLYDQLEELTAQLDEASLSLKIKDQEIQDLNNKVASLQQSAQNQGKQDGGQKELETLQMEKAQLVALADDLEKQIDRLLEDRKGLEKEIADYQDKADFLDNYVVFVENNGSNLYHTYDCDDFTKSNFWAYSRKLAESQGFNPCPACKGAP